MIPCSIRGEKLLVTCCLQAQAHWERESACIHCGASILLGTDLNEALQSVSFLRLERNFALSSTLVLLQNNGPLARNLPWSARGQFRILRCVSWVGTLLSSTCDLQHDPPCLQRYKSARKIHRTPGAAVLPAEATSRKLSKRFSTTSRGCTSNSSSTCRARRDAKSCAVGVPSEVQRRCALLPHCNW
jgi:hypothetical protein